MQYWIAAVIIGTLGALTIITQGYISKTAMATCQIDHSHDVCFQALNP